MDESKNCEHSKRIDYLSLLKWSETDTKTFSGILNTLVQKVSDQIDSIENVVLCSQDEELYELSSEQSGSNIYAGMPVLVRTTADFSHHEVASPTIELALESSESLEDPSKFQSPTISLPESLNDTIDDSITDREFNKTKINILKRVNSLELTNPSSVEKLEKLRKIVKGSNEQLPCVESSIRAAKKRLTNSPSWDRDREADVSARTNTIRSQILSQSRSYEKVLDGFKNPSKSIPQFAPWDELFKTVRNNSITSSKDGNATVNLESRMDMTSSSFENLESQYEIDSSSDQNILTLDSASSAYEDQEDSCEDKLERDRSRNLINRVTQLKKNKKRKGKGMEPDPRRRDVDFKVESNRLSSSVPSEITNEITHERFEVENAQRKKFRTVPSVPAPNVRRSNRSRKKRNFYGDYDSEFSTSDDDDCKSNEDIKVAINNCTRDQTLIGNYLGEKYRSPVLEVRELEPSLLAEFQRLSDVLI